MPRFLRPGSCRDRNLSLRSSLLILLLTPAALLVGCFAAVPPELLAMAEEELQRELEEMNQEPEPFVPPDPTEITFRAVYHNIIDGDRLDDTIGLCAMSADGRKIAFRNEGGYEGNPSHIYLINTDGTGLQSFDVPDGIGQLSYVAISGDGQRAYFATSFNQTILKLEDGVVSAYDLTVDDGPDGLDTLRTTTTGEYVYFHGNRDYNIWRLRHDGTGLERVVDVDDPAFPEDGTSSFDISADASVLVFSALGAGDIYKLTGGAITPLTTDGSFSRPRITPDGRTVFFHASSSTDQPGWWTMSASGGDATWLSAWPDELYLATSEDGFVSFVGDTRATLDNSAFAIFQSSTFPKYAYSMSADGSLISFRADFNEIYVGHLADPDAVTDAPRVESIAFDPLGVPRDDPDAEILAVAEVTAPNGLEPERMVRVTELVDGRIARDRTAPVFFDDLYDHASSPDGEAGDSIFSGYGQPASGINDYDTVTVRISAYDSEGNVVVADAVLPVGD